VQATGMHSLMMVPVRASGSPVLGIAVFVRNENPLKFNEDDLRLAEELVAQTARHLENARRYSRQRTVALALQRNLLPHHLGGGPGLEIASHYVPADIEEGVGGDWFDVIARSGGSRVALVIGDVVGHGIGAAAAMGRLRTAVRTLDAMDLEPDELFRRLDQVVLSFAEDDLSDTAAVSTTTGATCLLLVYDPATRGAVAASAGHPPPILVSREGAVSFPEIPVGAPIGTGLSTYGCAELEIPEGSLIAMYTDGLVEGRRWMIEAGMDRLAEALAQPGVPLPELVRAAFEAQPTDEFSDRAELQLVPPKDDATLLLARTRAVPADPAGRPGEPTESAV
jgi:serine phosphatase RsbU (regulator of sigma subunit)